MIYIDPQHLSTDGSYDALSDLHLPMAPAAKSQ